jgi:membrane protease YdiL (CAAX protease family)
MKKERRPEMRGKLATLGFVQKKRKKDMDTSLRNRISEMFNHNRLVISAELFVVVALHALEVKDFPAILFSFPLGWISLWLRKLGWRGVGLRRPMNWLRTLGLGVLIGVAWQLVEFWIIDPLILQGGAKMDLSQFERIPGNFPNLIANILISGWMFGAFMEEMVLRGYIVNRFVDLLGDNQKGLTVGVLVGSILFAIGHMNLGIGAVIENFMFALVFAGLYLAARRNLWLPIIAHGVCNSMGFVFIYLGLIPIT